VGGGKGVVMVEWGGVVGVGSVRAAIIISSPSAHSRQNHR